MARKNALISVETTEAGEMLFTVEGAGSFTFAAMSAPEETRQQAMLHGFRQKISDGAAFPKEVNATAEDKLKAMQAIAERLSAGGWKAKRGDGVTVQTGIVLRAWLEYVETKAKAAKAPFDREAATKLFTDTGWATIRKISEVGEIIERIKAESGTASNVDANALLASLGL